VDQLLSGAPIIAGEFTRKRKDGSTGYHSFSGHVVREKNKIVGLECFLIDTTKLRTMREQYAMLFDQMLDGFALHEMVFDPTGHPVDYRFVAVNPAFEKITGLKASTIVGRCVREALPNIETKWIEVYGEVVHTGEPRRFEEYSSTLDKYFEVMAFRPQAGQFACLVRDVSTRKQLELQLLQSQKMEAVGQLAGGIAHDFSNILAAIMMHLGLLQRRPEVTPEMKSSLKELETEAKRATSLIRQLLMFSRRQVMQVCPIDLNDLLANLLKMLRRLLGEHIKLVFTTGATPLWIEADTGMIEQVVMNLCVNARDAMTKGGLLKIDAYAMTLKATEPLGDTESRSGYFVCLSISDTGCGMDATTLKHIFEPFFTTKEIGKGTGLGLATVYGIVKQHHGWINVRSTVGKGSSFRIFLPATAAPPEPVQHTQEPMIKGGSEGVLVVEDDVGFRSMVAMSLKMLGYRVFEATDSHAALALWSSHSKEIGVLFADMVLPEGMTGHELCQRLHKENPALHMIITTGYSVERVNLTQLASEGIAFLPKPFTAESLASVVRSCIDKT
jgi:PAS domain S-box-containing protein